MFGAPPNYLLTTLKVSKNFILNLLFERSWKAYESEFLNSLVQHIVINCCININNIEIPVINLMHFETLFIGGIM